MAKDKIGRVEKRRDWQRESERARRIKKNKEHQRIRAIATCEKIVAASQPVAALC
jgi:hypothetical protein